MQKIIKHPLFSLIVFLLIAGLVLINWPHNEKAILERQLKKVESNLQVELQRLESEASEVINAAKKDSISFLLVKDKEVFPIVAYQDDQMVYWNNTILVPEYKFVEDDFEIKFIRMPEGLFLARKWSFDQKAVVGFLPLYRSSKINNQYISSHYNPKIFSFQPKRLLDPALSAGNNICINDNCLFQVELDEGVISGITSKYNQWGSICLLLSFFLVIILILKFRNLFFSKFGVLNGLMLISFIIVGLRLSLLWLSFPRSEVDMYIFDATIFASSWLNPTLGDLLINLLLLLVIVVHFFKYRDRLLLALSASKLKLFWGLLILLMFFFSALLLHLLIQTIYHNSQISLDINQNLLFDPLRITVFVTLLLVASVAFLIGHFIIRYLNEFSPRRESIRLIAVGFILFIVIVLTDNVNYILVPVVISIYIVIISFTKLYRSLFKIRFATYIYGFSWAVAASAIIAFATMSLEKEEGYENQVKFAEKFLVENDVLAEFLLNELNQKIKDDLFIQSRLSSPYYGKGVIKDKIRQVYLSDYFDKYDVNIHLFDAQGRPFNPFDYMLNPRDIQVSNKKYQTAYPNIFYIDEPGDEITGRYINLVEVKRSRGLRVGYILLDLRLKKLIPENVYPELLVDHRFLQSFQNNLFSYAVFRDNKIIYTSGKFNYANYFSNNLIHEDKIYDAGIETNNYQHKAVKDAEGNIYVISVPAHTIDHFFSNFSFFFLLVVIVVLVISSFYAISFLLRGSELYYSARIQLYLSLAFFIPMVVVTVITLNLVSETFKEEVIRENVKRAENIARNIAEDFINEPYENQVINLLLNASKYANADANIFTPGGRLIATSQPLIYENDLLAPYINPQAIVNINYNNEQMYTTDESVGDLEFKTTYHSIRSPETGSLFGILSVPFFQSEAALERHEIDIFTSVINIFTLIFLLFLLISYLASEYLIFPLKIITRKLQKTSLEFNEPLSWEANDEIGLMVKEYNRMVENLEESKKALAKSEKESAWREMAQQVAHEIKNPLTPMKLTLQHLQRTLSDKDGHVKKSVNTLLQQVNILSDIAGSFSAFASMPSPSKEKFDLGQVTLSATSLFSKNKGIDLQIHTADRPLIVEADEQLMGRIISNIVINAIEAGEGYQSLKININLEPLGDGTVILSIADNGPGIEEGVRENIFMPHFSTKRRGSGIGLAIARRGVEHAGGKIWFETEEGKGTTFFILLPLADV